MECGLMLIILFLLPMLIPGMLALLIPNKFSSPISVKPEKQTFGLIKLNFPTLVSWPRLHLELIRLKSPIFTLGPILAFGQIMTPCPNLADTDT